MTKIIKVAVPAPLFGDFDYLNNSSDAIAAGCRVRIPFGRRQMIGITLGCTAASNLAHNKLRKINSCIDNKPILNSQSLELARWLADYYHHPIGEVVFGMLPRALRLGSSENTIELTAAGRATLNTNTRAKKQNELCTLLLEGKQTYAELRAKQFSSSIIKICLDKKYISYVQADITMQNSIDAHLAEQPKTANAEQQSAIAAITAAAQFNCFVLFGITGSGKTEVYLQAIAKTLARNQQALILVPEISLTAQTINRFRQRFATEVVALHSSMTDTARYKSWQQAGCAKAGIVIGTRSAIFTQMPRLGIIIIDEEHDESYKQQNNLRYHARDVAVWRAKQLDIPVVLGSATPSLESWKNIQQKKFTLLQLTQRTLNATLPTIQIIDQRSLQAQQILHPTIIAQTKSIIAQEQQILFFLNRRGYAEVCMCFNCGFTETCAHCDGRLILHKYPQRLCCHRCDKTYKFQSDCKKCQQSQVQSIGTGTQQLEEVLQQQFPDENIIRIDRDSTKIRNSLEDKLQAAHNNAAKILVGTQMLAKGHDFDRLTCVVVINADCGLFSTDFRAEENLAQILAQVSGRAGRRQQQGQVLIQTLCPTHPLWLKLQANNYQAIAEEILGQRKEADLPPYMHQVLISSEHKTNSQAQQQLEQIAQRAKLLLKKFPHMIINGPVPAPIERINNRYRWQLWLQSNHRAQLHGILTQLIAQKSLQGVQIDVTPLNIL